MGNRRRLGVLIGIVLLCSGGAGAGRIALLESYDSQQAAQAASTKLEKELEKRTVDRTSLPKVSIEKEQGLWLLKIGPLPETASTPNAVEILLEKEYPNMIFYRSEQLKSSSSLSSTTRLTESWRSDRKLFWALLLLIVLIGAAGIRLRSRHLRRLKDGLRHLEAQIDLIKARLK